MTNENLLNALVSRVASRETASIALITISSTASLVLLGYVIDFKDQYGWISVLGILFPIIAFAYDEVTRLTIQKSDQKWIRKIVKCDENTTENSEEILNYTKQRTTRYVLARIILSIPLIGWIIFISINYGVEYACWYIGLGIILIIVTIVCLSQAGKPEKIDCEKADK